MREVRIRLEVTDLSSLRWAISPAWELLASLRVLARPASHAVHMDWLSRHRGDRLVAEPEHQMIRDLIGTGRRLPGFLAPTPESPLTGVDDELDVVRATPAAVVRREVTGVHSGVIPRSLEPLMRAPRRNLNAVVANLRAYWSRAIEPAWPRLRGVLERDIQHRAMTMADGGPGAMLSALHHDIRWDPASDTLTIANRLVDVADPDRALVGRGLVLVPSVFSWPRVSVKTAEPWAPVIRYPTRGVGTLWDSAQPTHDLTAALGATRTRLLHLLDVPSTTDQLARTLGLAPGGVSSQLHRLVTAGLATRTRVGREVYYARTARAEGLLR